MVTSQVLPIEATPHILEPTDTLIRLPGHLMTQLEKWHQHNPSTRPPAGVATPGKYRASKVFDRQGRELLIRWFRISKLAAATYYVQVLCPGNAPAKFVLCGSLHHRNGTWLKGWLGPDEGTEKGFCAIRRFGDTLNEVTFKADLWDNAPTDTMNPPTKRGRPPGSSNKRPQNVPASNLVSVSDSESEEEPVEPPRKSSRQLATPQVPNDRRSSLQAQAAPVAPAAPALEAPAPVPRSPSAATTSSGSTASGSTASGSTTSGSTTSTDSDESTVDYTGVVFKFIYPRGVETRVVSIKGTGRGEELFNKGKMFFQLLNPKAKVDCLVCCIPSTKEVRHLFHGAWDEVDLFVGEIESIQAKTARQEVIEVQYARI